MVKVMKKFKYLTLGIIIGLTISAGASVYADVLVTVNTFIMDNIKFEFNGVEKEKPQDYTVLNYKNRVYVPARFIAEELGAEVLWDAETETIMINQEEEEPEVVEEPEETEEPKDVEEPEISNKYEDTPVSISDLQLNLGIEDVIYDEQGNRWRLYVKLENKEDKPIRLSQLDTKIIVDGVEYSMDKVPLHTIDDRWYRDIREDERLSGYIAMPQFDKDSKKMDVVLTIIENTEKQEKKEFEFFINLQK